MEFPLGEVILCEGGIAVRKVENLYCVMIEDEMIVIPEACVDVLVDCNCEIEEAVKLISIIKGKCDNYNASNELKHDTDEIDITYSDITEIVTKMLAKSQSVAELTASLEALNEGHIAHLILDNKKLDIDSLSEDLINAVNGNYELIDYDKNPTKHL